MAYTDKERFHMAAAIFAEARGESKQGQEAVGQVILNRRKASFGLSISDVIYGSVSPKYGQFSFGNPGDPNRAATQKAIDGKAPAWNKALKAADDVLSGKAKNTVGKSTYYYTGKAPKWSRSKGFKNVANVGAHKFYTAPVQQVRSLVRDAAKSKHRRTAFQDTNNIVKDASFEQHGWGPIGYRDTPYDPKTGVGPKSLQQMGILKPASGALENVPAPVVANAPLVDLTGQPATEETDKLNYPTLYESVGGRQLLKSVREDSEEYYRQNPPALSALPKPSPLGQGKIASKIDELIKSNAWDIDPQVAEIRRMLGQPQTQRFGPPITEEGPAIGPEPVVSDEFEYLEGGLAPFNATPNTLAELPMPDFIKDKMHPGRSGSNMPVMNVPEALANAQQQMPSPQLPRNAQGHEVVQAGQDLLRPLQSNLPPQDQLTRVNRLDIAGGANLPAFTIPSEEYLDVTSRMAAMPGAISMASAPLMSQVNTVGEQIRRGPPMEGSLPAPMARRPQGVASARSMELPSRGASDQPLGLAFGSGQSGGDQARFENILQAQRGAVGGRQVPTTSIPAPQVASAMMGTPERASQRSGARDPIQDFIQRQQRQAPVQQAQARVPDQSRVNNRVPQGVSAYNTPYDPIGQARYQKELERDLELSAFGGAGRNIDIPSYNVPAPLTAVPHGRSLPPSSRSGFAAQQSTPKPGLPSIQQQAQTVEQQMQSGALPQAPGAGQWINPDTGLPGSLPGQAGKANEPKKQGFLNRTFGPKSKRNAKIGALLGSPFGPGGALLGGALGIGVPKAFNAIRGGALSGMFQGGSPTADIARMRQNYATTPMGQNPNRYRGTGGGGWNQSPESFTRMQAERKRLDNQYGRDQRNTGISFGGQTGSGGGGGGSSSSSGGSFGDFLSGIFG